MAVNPDSRDFATRAIGSNSPDKDQHRKQRSILRRAGNAAWYRFRKHILYDTLFYPYARYSHRKLVSSAERSQAHTYTSFYRSPAQLDALTSKVVPFVLRGNLQKSISIHVVACSTGAEAYTIASELMHRHPALKFEITASDLHDFTVAQARTGRYSASEVFDNGDVTEEFIAQTFDRDGDDFVVKPALRECVTFCQASLLDSTLTELHPPADIVFAQNVFFHLYPSDAEKGFQNVLRLLRTDTAALFVDGTELDMKVRATRTAGLEPLNYRVREIYSYARRHIPERWWNYYYGAEPYFAFRSGKTRRYSTIFLRDSQG